MRWSSIRAAVFVAEVDQQRCGVVFDAQAMVVMGLLMQSARLGRTRRGVGDERRPPPSPQREPARWSMAPTTRIARISWHSGPVRPAWTHRLGDRYAHTLSDCVRRRALYVGRQSTPTERRRRSHHNDKRTAPKGGPFVLKKPAATYSPGPLRAKYHRRGGA